ncbi:MAG: transposase [Bacteroidetes bacterium B1(2017)]|nr:MAG: transposase [Bacteroidetes bacterium B1(2017)]
MQLLEERLAVLEKENAFLRERLAKYENPKNSRNSSIPPSKDENRPLKTKSLRQQTGAKVGGQKGHEGNTLKMTEHPDQIIDYVPDFCVECGSDLQDVPVEFIGKRQVVDIPIIKPQYVEHRIYQKQCNCGHATCGNFPQNVNASISYGANTESLIGYLFSRQYMPFDRMREFLNNAYHLPISIGGIHELLNRLTVKAAPAYELIKQKIVSSKVVGTDETGAKIDGKKCWFWTWQNDHLTFIAPSDNRGFATIKSNFENGFKNAVLVHDCWKSHFQIQALNHQICTAHLLRELNYFIEVHKDKWAIKFQQLIRDALAVKQKMKHNDYGHFHQPKSDIESRFLELLEQKVDEKIAELVSFHKRMLKYKAFLFNFLKYPDVPPDNNGSERAIRNIKVKQKISGQFKSFGGAMNFAILRSITDTAIKNSQNVLKALFTIARLEVTD